jgi:hypothetical protein
MVLTVKQLKELLNVVENGDLQIRFNDRVVVGMTFNLVFPQEIPNDYYRGGSNEKPYVNLEFRYAS